MVRAEDFIIASPIQPEDIDLGASDAKSEIFSDRMVFSKVCLHQISKVLALISFT